MCKSLEITIYGDFLIEVSSFYCIFVSKKNNDKVTSIHEM